MIEYLVILLAVFMHSFLINQYRARVRLEVLSKLWTDLHPPCWIRGYRPPNVAASFCHKMSWTCWRYSNGPEEAEKYLVISATGVEDQPLLA
jgi:hypothetical protein